MLFTHDRLWELQAFQTGTAQLVAFWGTALCWLILSRSLSKNSAILH